MENKLLTIVEMVTSASIMANNKKKENVEARMIYSYILRHSLGTSLASIGTSISKDHTTILHYLKKMDTLLLADPELVKKHIICKELLNLSQK
jgi:chromosomal replication initiation ATPase DnaA